MRAAPSVMLLGRAAQRQQAQRGRGRDRPAHLRNPHGRPHGLPVDHAVDPRPRHGHRVAPAAQDLARRSPRPSACPRGARRAASGPTRAGAMVPSRRERVRRGRARDRRDAARRVGRGGGVAGGCFAFGFGLLAFEVTEVKKAHVSKSPKAERSCGPVTFVTPPVPTTCARTTRGETPRCSDLDALEAPLQVAVQLALDLGGGEAERAPAVLGRDAVERVVDGLQPRLGLRADERVLDVLGLAAGGREEVGGHRLAAEGDDLARWWPARRRRCWASRPRRRGRPASACRRTGRRRPPPAWVVIA